MGQLTTTPELSVVKRDGRVVPFDISRIENVITRAWREVWGHIPDPDTLDVLAGRVADRVRAEESITGSDPSVEFVQDCVERELMARHQYDVAKAYILYRAKHAEQRSERPIPPEVKAAFDADAQYFPTPLQELVYYLNYSRFNADLGRRETWVETVDRTVDFLKELADGKLSETAFDLIRDAILNMRVMPSMRLLAMAGAPARRNSMALQNCSYLAVDDLAAFREALLISMSGCGVGFSVESKYVDKLPVVQPQKDYSPDLWVIEDSAEGWAAALDEGINRWMFGHGTDFDYSQIRPAGTVLKTKGGRASGSGPLKEMLEGIRERILSRQGKKLRPIDCHDLMCMVGSAAVSGGVRRTAMISLFDEDDVEMLAAKAPGFDKDHSYRWNANNSAVRSTASMDNQQEFAQRFMEMVASGNGEPGIFSRDVAATLRPERRLDADYGTNPCFAAGTLVQTRDGHFPIETLIGKSVEIWNGNGWQRVNNFRITSENEPMLKVTLHDGSEMRATRYHTFILEDGTRIEAHRLVAGMILMRSTAPGVEEKASGFNEIVRIEADGIDEKVYCCTVEGSHSFALTNGIQTAQCGEIILRSGQFCNLSAAILRAGDTIETLLDKVLIATLIGTIQSMATTFPGLRPHWKANVEEERLLGVDITGQQDNPDLLTAANLEHLRLAAAMANEAIAAALGINPSAAITCVKPSGNTSQLVDCASGLHARWAPYYIRNVRVSAASPVARVLADAGVPLSPENGDDPTNPRTWVASFPVKAPEGAVTRNDRSAVEQCEWWLRNKLNYTEHNPSVTITYKPAEVLDLMAWVWEHRASIGGMSFLPSFDAKYDQLPYIEIDKDEYERRAASFPEIDWSKIWRYETDDRSAASTLLSCDGEKCEIAGAY